MQVGIKEIFYRGYGCIKRGLILSFPIFFVTMLLIDILTIAHHYYPNNLSAYILAFLGGLFYISCLWCIFVPLNKWNKTLFIVACFLFIGMFKLNPDIQKFNQYSKCIEVSGVPCPDGIVLGGG